MADGIRLASPVDLGSGRSIQPPEGWTQAGFVVDNPLGLLPKSRLSWHPPDLETVSLHWQLGSVPLPREAMDCLTELINSATGRIAVERIEPLYPTLIRMPLESIRRIRVVSYGEDVRLLGVAYALPQSGESGLVHYGLTEMAHLGEFQTLGYEGREPEYGRYWEEALAALESFRETNADLVDSEEPQPKTEPSRPEPAAEASRPQPVVEPSRPQTTSEVTSARPARPRRKTAELRQVGTLVHELEPGETIKALVNKRWPGLDESGKDAKLKEIYVLNRIHENLIEAWNLKPGMKVFLPDE